MAYGNLDLALVGNCTWGALIDGRARVVWGCLPRFDSDPVFPALLDRADGEDGTFAIALEDFESSTQGYDGNTAILVTLLRDTSGGVVEVRDFAPRFAQHGRIYRPTMLVRRVTPLSGAPRIRIVLRPRTSYGGAWPTLTHGSNHVRYIGHDITLRLTTNAPISYAIEGTPFTLRQRVNLALGPDETFSGSLETTLRDFEDRTREYWVEWSRALSIPFEWQEAVIRAAMALKLCSYEDTGAIVAALTTSIPEAPGTGRNWDYRYCWLRDAYFVVHALNRLGATRTMESYLAYLENLVAAAGGDGGLHPVYGIGLESELHERIADALEGYRGYGPVRVGNQAWEHVQNDVYGSVVLAATQSFFDRRLVRQGDLRLFELLEGMGRRALASWDQPDAGPWELRSRSQVHTFSSVMCWAACDRLARIATQLPIAERAKFWRGEADRIRVQILERAWNEKRRCFTHELDGDDVDATLLLLHELGFVSADDPRFASTVTAVEKELRRGSYLFRYVKPDDFGHPQTAFNVCTFWYIGALAALGRREEARELFENMLDRRNAAGLLSEDLDPATGEPWGNFPQTYSLVGLINAATQLSRRWREAF